MISFHEVTKSRRDDVISHKTYDIPSGLIKPSEVNNRLAPLELGATVSYSKCKSCLFKTESTSG